VALQGRKSLSSFACARQGEEGAQCCSKQHFRAFCFWKKEKLIWGVTQKWVMTPILVSFQHYYF
jgi:hypothetical protein